MDVYIKFSLCVHLLCGDWVQKRYEDRWRTRNYADVCGSDSGNGDVLLSVVG